MVVWAQDMRKITGRVLEAASGEPLPGATVFIDPDAPEAKEYNPAPTAVVTPDAPVTNLCALLMAWISS